MKIWILAAGIALDELFQFWRGYHHFGSILAGIVAALCNLMVWALIGLIVWVFYGGSLSKKRGSD